MQRSVTGMKYAKSTTCNLQEFQAESLPLLLTRDVLDRMIMARLLDAPAQYPQWPLAYLIGCYGRAAGEIRALSSFKDKSVADALQLDLQYCKDLIVANAGLLLTLEDSLFPQVDLAARFVAIIQQNHVACWSPCITRSCACHKLLAHSHK